MTIGTTEGDSDQRLICWFRKYAAQPAGRVENLHAEWRDGIDAIVGIDRQCRDAYRFRFVAAPAVSNKAGQPIVRRRVQLGKPRRSGR